jgi:prophage antirepressor-like protein
MTRRLVPASASWLPIRWLRRSGAHTIIRGGQEWFVAKDVCHPDAFDLVNVSDAVSELDPDEKDVIVFTDSAGRPNRMLIVSEPGLYNLSKGSNKPGAKRFWRCRVSHLRATPAAWGGAGYCSD